MGTAWSVKRKRKYLLNININDNDNDDNINNNNRNTGKTQLDRNNEFRSTCCVCLEYPALYQETYKNLTQHFHSDHIHIYVLLFSSTSVWDNPSRLFLTYGRWGQTREVHEKHSQTQFKSVLWSNQRNCRI